MGRYGESWVIVQVFLLALFIFVPPIGPAWPNPDAFRFIGWAFSVTGFMLLAWSAFSLGRSFTPFPRPLPQGQLAITGAYRFVRHPMYFAVLIVCLGLALATLNPLRLVLTLVLFVFFDLKSRREENWLLEQYPEYTFYKMRVRKLIPGIY